MLLRERLEAIVSRHLPVGYELEINPRLRFVGECYGLDVKKIMLARPVNTVSRLQVFLHEVIHAKLYHVDEEPRVPNHVSEYEAERLSMEWVRVEGFPVTAAMECWAAQNIARAAAADRRAGVPLRKDILEWCQDVCAWPLSRRAEATYKRVKKLLEGLS